MRFLRFSAVSAIIPMLALCACGGDKDASKGMPESVRNGCDVVKVKYVMDHAEPDSVARFICAAALGNVPGIKIDTIANAVGYVYQTYPESKAVAFAEAFDSYPNTLPLDQKMKLLTIIGEKDPMQLGYQLGLEYVDEIRKNNMSAADVEAEIEALRKACSSDPTMFSRFLKGFQVALKIDHGKDLPDDIYQKFVNYQ